MFAFVLLLGLYRFFVLRERLTVTEEGLRGRRFGVLQMVRWRERRLFARVNAITFELVSSTGMVRFSYLKDEESLQPTIPFAQYCAEIFAVFALIAERTGLPLIDYCERTRR